MATKISESNGTPAANQEAIARRAHEIWENEGRPEGRAMEHWLRAVSELKAQSARKSAAEQRQITTTTKPGALRRSTPRVADRRF